MSCLKHRSNFSHDFLGALSLPTCMEFHGRTKKILDFYWCRKTCLSPHARTHTHTPSLVYWMYCGNPGLEMLSHSEVRRIMNVPCFWIGMWARFRGALHRLSFLFLSVCIVWPEQKCSIKCPYILDHWAVSVTQFTLRSQSSLLFSLNVKCVISSMLKWLIFPQKKRLLLRCCSFIA